jgi:hypothetical protein
MYLLRSAEYSTGPLILLRHEVSGCGSGVVVGGVSTRSLVFVEAFGMHTPPVHICHQLVCVGKVGYFLE